MSTSLEAQIIRLVEEIAEDEKNVIKNEKVAYDSSYTDHYRNEYAMKAKTYRESLERKMRLLQILKGETK